MNILHIVSNISIRSGVMSVIMSYYRNLAGKDITFTFLYFDDSTETYEDEIKKLGGNIYKIKTKRSFFKITKEIRKYIIKNIDNISIVHLHEVYLIWALLFLKKKVKIVAHAHATKFSENPIKNFRNRIMSTGRTLISSSLFACSKRAGKYIFGNKFNKNGWVMNNAIDSDKFKYDSKTGLCLKKQLKINNKFIIGHIGNFNIQKNHNFLINVFVKVLQEEPNAILVLVGDGKNKKDIEAKCEKYGILDNVLFLGTRKDVYNVIQAFDVFVLPSKYEGLGIVLIEAQAAGIPCVFSDVVPQEANILKGNNTTISLTENCNIWAQEILKFRKHKKSITTKMIKNAGYDIKKEAQNLYYRYKTIYKDVN